jgi:plastocyanin domain-containing protein
MIVVINVLLLILIGFIAYWFWFAKTSAAQQALSSGTIDVLVDKGVYSPAQIHVKAGEPVTLRFTRKAASPCAAIVVFSDLSESIELPLNEPVTITLQPEVGEYAFSCEMGMYQGKLVVS